MTTTDDSSRGGLLTRMRRGRREPFAGGTVTATPADVWRLVSDVTRIQEWWPRALDGQVAEGEGQGREQIVRLNWGREPGIVRQRVVAYEPNCRYAWRVLSEAHGDRELPPLTETTVTIRIDPENAISRVRIDGRFDPIGARGVLALRQLSRLAKRSYRQAVKNLESILAPPR